MGSQALSSEPGRLVSSSSASSLSTSRDGGKAKERDIFSSNTENIAASASRESIDRKSVTFEDGDMAGGSRKRLGRRDESSDEAAPIIQNSLSKADYQSISPNVGPRRMAEGAAGTAQEGTPGLAQQESAERVAANITRREGGKWRRWLEEYGSVELENKGSVARDHLALERTFLAWLRTSLSFASIGIAITQLFRLNTSISSRDSSDPDAASNDSPRARMRHVGKPLGATFIAISIVILFIGFHRYFEAQHYVIRGKFPASRGSIIIVSLVAGALIVSSLVVILAVAPGAFEK